MTDLKQTAMQKLIELCEGFKAEFTESDAMSFATKATYSAVINSAKLLLPIEREQIIDAHNSGIEIRSESAKYNILGLWQNGNKYFDQNFKQ